MSNIADLIAHMARTNPDLDVLTFEHEGEAEVRTYRQLWANAQRIAACLAERGVKKGDRFALLILNHPEFVETMAAAAILGAVFVPIDARTRGAKLAYILRDSQCIGALCAPYSLTGLIEAAPDTPALQWALVLGQEVSEDGREAGFPVLPLGPALRAPPPDPPLPIAIQSDADPMQVAYTSGTTGDPKGILIPHARFIAVSNQGEAVFGYRLNDRPYSGLSLTHGNAQFVTLAPSLRMGLRAVISRKFTKSRLWDIVRRHSCTTFTLLGGMATAIYAAPRRADDADNPVRHVVSAGMPASIWQDFELRFGVHILEFYGAMEGGMAVKRIGEGPIGSCGRPPPGLIARVLDEDGREAPPGVSGELVFRLESGPFPPVTYLNNPRASSNKVVDGWLRSGDIVHMDKDGWIFFEYRKGGGIRRNGEFIDPALIERALAQQPCVDDIFVYGMAAKSGAPGEKDIVAAIVPAGEGCLQDLLRCAREQLAPNLRPDYIQLVAEIPKTASEKPQERFLLELFRGKPATVYAV